MRSGASAIFPISSEHVTRIFNECRTVFVKYTNFVRLGKNSKLIFYVSKEKKLIGEGTIESMEKMNPGAAWARYDGKIFVSETEYSNYASTSVVGRKNRKMAEITVFVLKNLKKYRNPVPWKNMTTAGCYLNEDEYQKISAGQKGKVWSARDGTDQNLT